MIDKLPYTLTKGVTAAREGLVIEKNAVIAQAIMLAESHQPQIMVGMQTAFRWPDAAERLRYREGEPYCELYIGELGRTGFLRCEPPFTNPGNDCIALHRLAAILADDAEGFRILWWCIHNLCNTSTDANHGSNTGVTPDGGGDYA